jgi:prepilin-type N-terminal cleavage/methylation domain-containing protein
MKSMLHHRKLSRGVSLIELLVAITIGAVLLFGATQVYVDSRKTYEINNQRGRT